MSDQIRTKFPDAISVLDQARRARNARVLAGGPRIRKDDFIAEKVVLRLLNHNGQRPVVDGLTIFRMEDGDLIIEDCLTPEMLELPEDMREEPIKIEKGQPCLYLGNEAMIIEINPNDPRRIRVWDYSDDGAWWANISELKPLDRWKDGS